MALRYKYTNISIHCQYQYQWSLSNIITSGLLLTLDYVNVTRQLLEFLDPRGSKFQAYLLGLGVVGMLRIAHYVIADQLLQVILLSKPTFV